MCCRYYMELSPELKPYIDRAKASSLTGKITAVLGRPLKTEGEVRPTDIAPVIAPGAKSLSPAIFPMVWGFTNPRNENGAPLLNARSETACKKPFWKEAWQRRRCIIPASYYFEWEHYKTFNGKTKTGQKYMIQTKSSPVTYMAGLYGFEERNGMTIPVFTILTREPGKEIRFIHDRMPVVLPENAAIAWVSPEIKPEEIISEALIDMFYDKAV